VRISSLALWQQVLDDSRVNSPFQRFKRNLLLWLQLLALLALVLAAMQPFVRAPRSRGMNLPIIIDCSASMATTLRHNGPSRLDMVRRRAATRIDGIVRGQRICLITAGQTARKLTDFTDNKRELLAALHTIEVEDVPSDISDALRIAQALGRAVPVEEVVLLTDGNVPKHADVELPFTLTFERTDAPAANAGITSLRAVRADATQWRVFVGIDASAAFSGAATLRALGNGEELIEEIVSPTFDTPERVVFLVSGQQPSQLKVQLIPDGADGLASDNEAYLELPALRRATVHIPESLTACRYAVGGMADVVLWPTTDAPAPAGASYDVALASTTTEPAADASISLTFGMIPAAVTGVVAHAEGSDRVVDWDRSAPLLQHVTLSHVGLNAGTRFLSPNGQAALESQGWQTLIHGERGPLLIRSDSPNHTDYALLVRLEETTLPYRVAFPVLLSNLIRLALDREGLTQALARPTGTIRGLRSTAPNATCRVNPPIGPTQTLSADAKNRLPGLQAKHVGTYRIQNATPNTVSVSLLSPLESRLESIDQILFAEVSVTSTTKTAPTSRAIWPWLALAALLILIIEWAAFNRLPTLAKISRSE
jgi:Ca-activated chloride channel family protein